MRCVVEECHRKAAPGIAGSLCRFHYLETVAGLPERHCEVCQRKLRPRSKYTHCDKHVSRDPAYRARKKARAAESWPLYYARAKDEILASKAAKRLVDGPEAEEARRKKAAHEAKRRNLSRGIDPTGILAAFASGMHLRPCAKCGATDRPCEVDHLLPKVWAATPEVAAVLGQHWAYQPLCESCNSSKGARWIEVYVPTGDIGADETP